MAPTQPKRPVGGAYGIFMSENREKFTKACAGQKASEVSKMGGAEWKKLSDASKKPFEKKFAEVKATYEKDLQAFKDAGGVLEKGARAQRSERRKEREGTGKKKKDPNAPKRPAGGAYGQYLNANREAIKKQLPSGSNPITDVAKKASELWAKLSAAEKTPYEKKFQKQNEEYKKAMEEWKQTHAEEEEEDDDEEDEDYEEPVVKKSRKAGA